MDSGMASHHRKTGSFLSQFHGLRLDQAQVRLNRRHHVRRLFHHGNLHDHHHRRGIHHIRRRPRTDSRCYPAPRHHVHNRLEHRLHEVYCDRSLRGRQSHHRGHSHWWNNMNCQIVILNPSTCAIQDNEQEYSTATSLRGRSYRASLGASS
jgi:hypothetical protein